MGKKDINPGEALVEEVSDDWVELVLRLLGEIAPVRPWWHETLSMDEQLWRWMTEREKIMPWLYDAAQFMGWSSPEDVLDGLMDLFTKPIEDHVPVELLIDPRLDSLRDMVQSQGPLATAQHVRKMEREVMRREKALAPVPEVGVLESLPVQPPAGLYEQDPFEVS